MRVVDHTPCYIVDSPLPCGAGPSGDGKAKLQQLRCGNVMEQIRRRTQKAEVKLLAEEVLASLKAAAT
jgi:hypothetical protein